MSRRWIDFCLWAAVVVAGAYFAVTIGDRFLVLCTLGSCFFLGVWLSSNFHLDWIDEELRKIRDNKLPDEKGGLK